MKKILVSLGSIASFALPLLASAKDADFGYFHSVASQGYLLLGDILVFLIALAVVWFIFNVIRYVMSSEEDGKGKAKTQMIWGIVAIAVVVSVWGIVRLLQGAFGVENNNGSPSQSELQGFIPGGSSNSGGSGGYPGGGNTRAQL